jgi:hypothetical protein
MIGLKSQFNDFPRVLLCYLRDNLFESIMDRSYEHLSSSFRAPDDVIYHQMDSMLFMFVLHVAMIACNNI